MRSALKSLALGVTAAFVAGSALASGTLTYNSTTGTPIPDLTTVTNTIVVPATDWTGSDTIRDVNVYINLSHTWDSDLTLKVTGPDGTEVPLWAGVGGSSDGFDVTIDDEAAMNINAIVGTFRTQRYPTDRLCEFDGKDPGGAYTLTISDTVGGDSGFLNRWSVTIEGAEGRFTNDCEADRVRRGRGLGSHANNGGGNGEDLNPPGQRPPH